MKKIFYFFVIALALAACDKAADSGVQASGPSVGNSGGSGTGGSLARFTAVGNYLYVVDRESIRVFDVTNPAQPQFKRSVPAGFDIETIYPFQDKLFLGSASVVYIFDITDPSNPRKQGEAISPNVMRRCDPVVARDTVAYATLRTDGPCGGTQSILAVFNVRDVQHPVQVTTRPLESPYGLGYIDNTLYVCDRRGINVFDIRSAYQPTIVRQVAISGATPVDVIPQGNVLVVWTTTGIVLYDITNRNDPAFLTQIR